MSFVINLPQQDEQRLREEAARRNSSVEVLATQLLIDTLRLPKIAESEITDTEASFFVDAVHQARLTKSQ